MLMKALTRLLCISVSKVCQAPQKFFLRRTFRNYAHGEHF
jgi:hypothetical protein